jgi:hypothetical protein
MDEFKNSKINDPQLKNELETSYTNKIYKNVSKLIDEIDLYKTLNNMNMRDIINEKIFNKYNKKQTNMTGGATVEENLIQKIRRLQEIIKELESRPEVDNTGEIGLWYCENKDKIIQTLDKLLVILIMIYFPEVFLKFVLSKINNVFDDEITSGSKTIVYKKIKAVINASIMTDQEITNNPVLGRIFKNPILAPPLDKFNNLTGFDESNITNPDIDKNYNLVNKLRNIYLYYAILKYVELVENKYYTTNNTNTIYATDISTFGGYNFNNFNLNEIFHNTLNLTNIFTEYFSGDKSYNILDNTTASVTDYYITKFTTPYYSIRNHHTFTNSFIKTNIETKNIVVDKLTTHNVTGAQLNAYLTEVNVLIDRIYGTPEITELYEKYYEKLMDTHKLVGVYTQMFFIITKKSQADEAKINFVKPLINLANRYIDIVPPKFRYDPTFDTTKLSVKKTDISETVVNTTIFKQSTDEEYQNILIDSPFNINALETILLGIIPLYH